MLGKLKQAGDMLKAQKQFFELQKKLGNITAEVEEGNVKIQVKGAISFYKIESVEVNGEKIENLAKAQKQAEKVMNKKMQQLAKTGELKGLNLF